MTKVVAGWITFISLSLSTILMLILGIDSFAEGITPLLVEDEIYIFVSYSFALIGGFIYLLNTRFWEMDNPRIRQLQDQIQEERLKAELKKLKEEE